MKKTVSFRTTAFDLLWIQLTITFWYLGIFSLINIGKLIFGSGVSSFYSTGYMSSNIFMLIVGIIAINFLPYFVENGITRKNYFLGNTIASIGLSIILPIIIYAINLLEKLIVNNFTTIALKGRSLDEIDMDGNFIGDIVQSIIITPFINPESNLILSLALFSLHIFVFYIIGWLIGAAFYRLGAIGGIIFVLIGVALLSIKDSMIRLALDVPLFPSFEALDFVPKSLALPLVAIVILVTLILIRLLTKRVAIKM